MKNEIKRSESNVVQQKQKIVLDSNRFQNAEIKFERNLKQENYFNNLN